MSEELYVSKLESYGNIMTEINRTVKDHESVINDTELGRLWRMWIDMASLSNVNRNDDCLVLFDNFYIPDVISNRRKKYCEEHNIEESDYDGPLGKPITFNISPRLGTYNRETGTFISDEP